MDTASSEMACPVCGTEMEPRSLVNGEVHSCRSGHGVFLRRADLGGLVESEREWHLHTGHHTQPLPRITADMTAPPAGKPPARAWVETLFS